MTAGRHRRVPAWQTALVVAASALVVAIGLLAILGGAALGVVGFASVVIP